MQNAEDTDEVILHAVDDHVRADGIDPMCAGKITDIFNILLSLGR